VRRLREQLWSVWQARDVAVATDRLNALLARYRPVPRLRIAGPDVEVTYGGPAAPARGLAQEIVAASPTNWRRTPPRDSAPAAAIPAGASSSTALATATVSTAATSAPRGQRRPPTAGAGAAPPSRRTEADLWPPNARRGGVIAAILIRV